MGFPHPVEDGARVGLNAANAAHIGTDYTDTLHGHILKGFDISQTHPIVENHFNQP
jgi:hypothetical protein